MNMDHFLMQRKEIYDVVLDFIDNNDDFTMIENMMNEKILDNEDELKEFVQMILIISNNHHRKFNFFVKIEQILHIIVKNSKKPYFNKEMFEIFKINKRLLLYLFKNDYIEINDCIIDMILQQTNEFIDYFYPEIKSKASKMNFSKEFEHKRQIGENDSYICELIRNDSIIEFIQYVNQKNYPISSVIPSSIFETNSFLLEQKPTLIEYAAFFGSIQIFQYLKLNNVNLSPSLWLYAIHSGNAELIHILESDKIIPDDQSFYKCFEESIKCHHNEIAHYIQDNLINKSYIINNDYLDPFFKDNEFSYGFHYYNYDFFPKKSSYRFLLPYACKFGYLSIVKLFAEKVDLRVKNEIIIS